MFLEWSSAGKLQGKPMRQRPAPETGWGDKRLHVPLGESGGML